MKTNDRPDLGATKREPSLRTVFAKHYTALLKMATLLSGRVDVAEDLVQEAFLRLVPRIDDLQEAVLRSYLRQTVLNLWRTQLRRGALGRLMLAQMRSLSEQTSALESNEVWDVVAKLPPRQRACIVLRYFEDLSEQEIARLLRCSTGSVKTHTHRALRRLRRELGE